MATLTEVSHAAEYVASEAPGNRSKQRIYLRSGNLDAGAVLARTVTATAGGSNVGDGTIGTLSADSEAPQGVYTLLCTAESANAGTFSVTGPDGVDYGDATVAVAFNNVVAFTIADGAEDFDTGDTFSLVVGMVEYDDTGSDGQQIAYGVLYDATDASSAAQWAMAHVRDCEVQKGSLQWGTGIDAGEQANAYGNLGDRGVIAL